VFLRSLAPTLVLVSHEEALAPKVSCLESIHGDGEDDDDRDDKEEGKQKRRGTV
jgi:hypothetical protein